MVTSFTGKRLAAAVLLAAALMLPYFILFYSPDIARETSLCPSRLLTGMPCPGCGMLKSWCYLTHGNWAVSLHFHPFGIPAYLLAVYFLFRVLSEAVTGKALPKFWEGQKKLTVTLLLLTGGFHAYRLAVIIFSGELSGYLHQGLLYKTFLLLKQSISA